jgi:inosose dehydratase
MERQFAAIREMGIDYADITDNHNGGMLGVEYGFAASVSLDSHPKTIMRMARKAGVKLTAFCAHANLLDPAAPEVYGTTEIIKAIRLAKLLRIEHVITTEGHPRTDFGQGLSPSERILIIREKLYTPILWAEELGVQLLIETHGVVTDSVNTMGELLDALGHEKSVGICLDTGNSWLGGANPVDHVRVFGSRVRHVHWKDIPREMESRRGRVFGTGMATIPLGDGAVDIGGVVAELNAVGFDGYTTLEIAGPENVLLSVERLRRWSAR